MYWQEATEISEENLIKLYICRILQLQSDTQNTAGDITYFVYLYCGKSCFI